MRAGDYVRGASLWWVRRVGRVYLSLVDVVVSSLYVCCCVAEGNAVAGWAVLVRILVWWRDRRRC